MTNVFNQIHCYLQIYLKNLDICIEMCELDPAHFLSAPG